jgi:hypothetical protein
MTTSLRATIHGRPVTIDVVPTLEALERLVVAHLAFTVDELSREATRLRFTTRFQTRFLEDYPAGWAEADEAQLAELWRRAEQV